jgi:hypothetical protein
MKRGKKKKGSDFNLKNYEGKIEGKLKKKITK